MNRDDFSMLKSDYIYFDNGATTFKPKEVIDKMNDYYNNYCANAHRGDYDFSMMVDNNYEDVRDKTANFINAKRREEIIFTSSATDAINRIVFGFMKNKLLPGDEILLNKAEHASNVLPWIELAKKNNLIIKYIPLNSNYEVDLSSVEKLITSKTRVLAIAQVSNVIGDVRPIKKLSKLCHQHNIYLVVDGAQSVPHLKVDVLDLDVDFLAFSAHKMLGPTGVGVLYGKYSLLNEMTPLLYGGGMNSVFESNGELEYKSLPERLEAGTPNIAGVIGLGAAIDYIENIGLDRINAYEKELKSYLVTKLKDIPNIIVYNANILGNIVTFNIKDVFSQDTAVYLNHYHICVRSGNHCTKMLKDEIKIKNTCRISFYFYNTKEEIDKLIEVLRKSYDIFKIVI